MTETTSSHMSNKAAWLTSAKERPLKVDDAPMPAPGPDDIIIRNHAVAINRESIGIMPTT
jgi:NADPH:quinone reductase-like Zn-dependent oxidoreductase